MQLLTINLDVRAWPALVVGGGTIALPKAIRLLEAGAEVTIIAPNIKQVLPGAHLLYRKAVPADLDGKKIAIFGSDDKQLNRELWREAQARGILSMAVDDPEAADFYSPAILRRGDLEIAVSTGGKGPAFSGRVRNLLTEIIDEAHGEALAWYAAFRKKHLSGLSMKKRIGISREVLAGDYAAWFRESKVDALETQAQEIVTRWSARDA